LAAVEYSKIQEVLERSDVSVVPWSPTFSNGDVKRRRRRQSNLYLRTRGLGAYILNEQWP